MPEQYYLNKLYPLQDEVLNALDRLGLDFYLSGGTALSRCFLGHRYSDDLDLFVNSHPDFKKQCEKLVSRLKNIFNNCSITITAESFLRMFVEKQQMTLKVDCINDVPFHYGGFEECGFFGRVDNWRNILSNKICALSRMDPKDYGDLLYIARKYRFEWEDIVKEAREKDLWVEPIAVSQMIHTFPAQHLRALKWIVPPDISAAEQDLARISVEILKGTQNSLADQP